MSGYEHVSSVTKYRGRFVELRVDTMRLPDGKQVERDVVVHPGAVGVVLVDGEDRVLLLHQYRHPVRRWLWELPAGVRDEDGESPLDTAKRELLEESGWTAATWHLLAETYSSAGMSDEHVHLYLARDPAEHDGERIELEDEERDLELRWLGLDEACAWVADGRLTNAMAVIGVLAAARARDTGYAGLRPA